LPAGRLRRAHRLALLLLGLACSAAPGPGGARTPSAGRLPLHECRLQHPLELSSIEAECGDLAVPLDRGTNDGNRLMLHVAVIRALDRRAAAAPLFLLAGGPGQAATDLYLAFAPAFARIAREHDIVLVDQRGTGRSDPITCDYPDDWRAAPDPLAEARDVTARCLARYGARVRFFTTGAAVEDLDAVREALGYARVDLYGGSYGTRVAQLYMRRFPSATEAVILDGVTAPEEVIGPDTPIYGERALDAIVARCAAAEPCAHAFPSLAEELGSLRQAFGPRKAPITIDDPSSGMPLEVEFNREMLGASLRFLSYSATQASMLPVLIHRGTRGALGPLAAQVIMTARQVRHQLATGMQNSVICSEDVPFYGAAGIDRAALAKTYQGTDQVDAFEEICRIWPRGPVDADLHAPLRSDIPTLLLSGEADPVTPPADAQRAARGLAHHRHLVLAGEGHGQLATGCIPSLMARFLESRAPEKLDTRCLERHRPAPFFVSPVGPSP
jgi:pimeloyl-ACP methyl ester carboxylesterase